MFFFGKSQAKGFSSNAAQSEQPAGAEKRKWRRIRTPLRTGQIYDMANQLLAECQVRDRSEGGARLRILGDIPLPLRFKFHDDVECTLVDVELRWRRKTEIGVQFVEAGEEG